MHYVIFLWKIFKMSVPTLGKIKFQFQSQSLRKRAILPVQVKDINFGVGLQNQSNSSPLSSVSIFQSISYANPEFVSGFVATYLRIRTWPFRFSKVRCWYMTLSGNWQT